MVDELAEPETGRERIPICLLFVERFLYRGRLGKEFRRKLTNPNMGKIGVDSRIFKFPRYSHGSMTKPFRKAYITQRCHVKKF